MMSLQSITVTKFPEPPYILVLMKNKYYGILVTVLLLTGCQSPATSTSLEEGKAIRSNLVDAHCKMEQLREQSAKLWDSLEMELAQTLPGDMPSDERRNMLQVRNAELIRMFEVFPRLPVSVRTAVEKAERQDQELAARMKVAMNRIDMYEAEAFAFLQDMEVVSADSAAAWQERFSTLPCRNKEKTEGNKVAN